jgi:hypothetical protein
MKTAIRTSCTAEHLDADIQRTARRRIALAYQTTSPKASQALAIAPVVDAAADACMRGVCDAT